MEENGKNLGSYAAWIKDVQVNRNKEWQFNVKFEHEEDTPKPPEFPHVSLFQKGVEEYSMGMTSLPTEDLQQVAKATQENEMFAPCMVGTLESQYLKMQVNIARAKRVLDVGTFTGMSALAMAEGIPYRDGKVVTIEFDDKIADVAEKNFKSSSVAHKLQLLRGRADVHMRALLEKGDKFDVVFIDADKESYITYYDIAMSGLLTENGFIMVDNSLCALLYDSGDERTVKIHEFNQHVRNDQRVDQVVCTLREGVTIIRPRASFKQI